MWRVLLARFQQGHRTMKFPDGPAPPLPDRLRGRPAIDASRCASGCRACADACPTSAIAVADPIRHIDLGRCLFCQDCVEACPTGAMRYTDEHRLAARRREDLVIDATAPITIAAAALEAKTKKLFRRSLKLRQVSAGGCNGCESDLNVLGTVGWDLARFGIQFVASPRHADGIVITGPVTQNMKLALEKTYAAVPAPKIVIAVGACAISGGPYVGHPEAHDGGGGILPVDLHIPGCPPHPLTILDGLLRMLGRIEEEPGRLPTG